MPAKSEKAAAAVSSLFASKPAATMDELLSAAQKADKRLVGIARRSFNASYVLPLKRAAAKKSGGTRRRRKKKRTVARKGDVAKRTVRRSGIRISESARAKARRMILQRDQLVLRNLRSGGDPQVAYELAANIDQYVEQLAAALRK